MHFRNTRSASPANPKYVMGWSSFLSQMITRPRAGASGKDLPEKSFKSAPPDSPASASDGLKASLQTEAGLRWTQSRRLTWTGRARWQQVLQVSLNIIFCCVKTSIINITVSRNRKLAGHCGQRGFARIEIIRGMISTIFPSLFTFPLPLPTMKKKCWCRFLPSYWIISPPTSCFGHSVIANLLLEGLIRIIKEEEHGSLVEGSLETVEATF